MVSEEIPYVARNALRLGGEAALQALSQDVVEQTKEDNTLVTTVDHASQAAIVGCIRESRFHNDTIIVEEGTPIQGTTSRTWYIDPFDGTSNIPIQYEASELGLAVEENGELVFGAILQPFTGRLVYATRSKGANELLLSRDGCRLTRGGYNNKLQAPEHGKTPRERYIWVDALFRQQNGGIGNAQRKAAWLADMSSIAEHVRTVGSNLAQQHALATGRGHISLTDAVGGFYDLAPGIPILTELGGRFTDLDGNTPRPGCQVAVATMDPTLHERVLEITRKHYGAGSPHGPYKGHA